MLTSLAGTSAKPRPPVRANGRRRYELLLDTAERLLQADDGQTLTIQRLAREAGVPAASVYHFLPHPAAVSIALSERYLAGLEAVLCAPIADHLQAEWPAIIAVLNRRAVHYYRLHPYAQRLILGSDHSLAIRRADLANNQRIAEAIAAMLAQLIPGAAPDMLLETVMTGIVVGDAVFTLSILSQGGISDASAQQAWLAACSYVAARHGLALPDPAIYSIFID
jgi:AcrR family transcriptional regulator